jgi:fucose permease
MEAVPGGRSKTEATPLVVPIEGPPTYLCIRTRRTAVLLTLLLVFLTFSIKQGSNALLGASLPELNAIGYQKATSVLPGVGTAAYACGKLSQIYLVYCLGPRSVLVLAAIVSGAGMFIFATNTTAGLFVGWIASQFANAHVRCIVQR